MLNPVKNNVSPDDESAVPPIVDRASASRPTGEIEEEPLSTASRSVPLSSVVLPENEGSSELRSACEDDPWDGQYFTIRDISTRWQPQLARLEELSELKMPSYNPLTFEGLVTFYQGVQEMGCAIADMVDRHVDVFKDDTDPTGIKNFLKCLRSAAYISGEGEKRTSLCADEESTAFFATSIEERLRVFSTYPSESFKGRSTLGILEGEERYISSVVLAEYERWVVALSEKRLSAFWKFLYMPPYNMDVLENAMHLDWFEGSSDTISAINTALGIAAVKLHQMKGRDPQFNFFASQMPANHAMALEMICRLYSLFYEFSTIAMRIQGHIKHSVQQAVAEHGLVMTRLDYAYEFAAAIEYLMREENRELLEGDTEENLEYAGEIADFIATISEKAAQFAQRIELSSYFLEKIYLLFAPVACLFEGNKSSPGNMTMTPCSHAQIAPSLERLKALSLSSHQEKESHTAFVDQALKQIFIFPRVRVDEPSAIGSSSGENAHETVLLIPDYRVFVSSFLQEFSCLMERKIQDKVLSSDATVRYKNLEKNVRSVPLTALEQSCEDQKLTEDLNGLMSLVGDAKNSWSELTREYAANALSDQLKQAYLNLLQGDVPDTADMSISATFDWLTLLPAIEALRCEYLNSQVVGDEGREETNRSMSNSWSAISVMRGSVLTPSRASGPYSPAFEGADEAFQVRPQQ